VLFRSDVTKAGHFFSGHFFSMPARGVTASDDGAAQPIRGPEERNGYEKE
jgi:hypothetical protein